MGTIKCVYMYVGCCWDDDDQFKEWKQLKFWWINRMGGQLVLFYCCSEL